MSAKTLTFVDQVRRLTVSAWAGVREHLDHVAELSQERVDVPELLQQYLRQVRLHSQATTQRLLAAWEQEGQEPTAYGAMNALTRVGTHETSLSLRIRHTLSGLAGVLAHRRTHICPHCFSVFGD